jgi:hypothetical protein
VARRLRARRKKYIAGAAKPTQVMSVIEVSD